MTTNKHDTPETELIFQKLNLETGQIGWPELQRHFARGIVIIVADELDLVEVARQFTLNSQSTVQQWLDQKLVRHASDDDALLWNTHQQVFWAVVVAPWVLVQPIS